MNSARLLLIRFLTSWRKLLMATDILRYRVNHRLRHTLLSFNSFVYRRNDTHLVKPEGVLALRLRNGCTKRAYMVGRGDEAFFVPLQVVPSAFF